MRMAMILPNYFCPTRAVFTSTAPTDIPNESVLLPGGLGGKKFFFLCPTINTPL